MKWSPQQENCLRSTERWMDDPSSLVRYVGGFAGTGKTTLARHLVAGRRKRWLFAAFTGKAAHVLRQKGCENASTIHSLIYRPAGETREHELRLVELRIYALEKEIGEKEPTEEQQKQMLDLKKSRLRLLSENEHRFALYENSPLRDPSVEGVVIDEASMVDQYLAKDLESFEKKILLLGDPAQLPPVGNAGYYTRRDPDVMLTEVHRHAENSGILRLATFVRNGGQLLRWTDVLPDVEIIRRADVQGDALQGRVLAAGQTLCGLNKTRDLMNHRHRELIGRKQPTPEPGDRLVCLRNDRALGLFNGSQWVVKNALADEAATSVLLTVISEDEPDIEVETYSWLHHMIGRGEELKAMGFDRRDQSEFDWAYAMTVHKAQGSQWDDVVLFDQSHSFRGDAKRWLYTGITRAAKQLTIVI